MIGGGIYGATAMVASRWLVLTHLGMGWHAFCTVLLIGLGAFAIGAATEAFVRYSLL